MMSSNGSFAEGYAIGRDSSGSNGGNNGNGFWGGDAWWAIIIFAMIFGWGNGGWGNGNGAGNGGANSILPYVVGTNGAVTRADLCEEFNANGLQNAVRGVNQGLCDGFYAMNTGMLNGFNTIGNAICNLGYEQAQLSNASNIAMMQAQNAIQTQLADCCCKNSTGQMEIANQIQSCCCTMGRDIERGFADANYNLATQSCAIQTQMANNTRDIIDSQREGTRAVLDYLCNEKISSLENENQALRLASSQQAQNNYLVNALRPCPIPAYISCNPWAGNAPYGSCGCNSNCGF